MTHFTRKSRGNFPRISCRATLPTLETYGRDWTRVYAPRAVGDRLPANDRRGVEAAPLRDRATRRGRAVGRAHRARGRRGRRRTASCVLSLARMRRIDPVDVSARRCACRPAPSPRPCTSTRRGGVTVAGRFRVEGLEPGRRQHRDQRRRREGHSLRPHAQLGARPRGRARERRGARARTARSRRTTRASTCASSSSAARARSASSPRRR